MKPPVRTLADDRDQATWCAVDSSYATIFSEAGRRREAAAMARVLLYGDDAYTLRTVRRSDLTTDRQRRLYLNGLPVITWEDHIHVEADEWVASGDAPEELDVWIDQRVQDVLYALDEARGSGLAKLSASETGDAWSDAILYDAHVDEDGEHDESVEGSIQRHVALARRLGMDADNLYVALEDWARREEGIEAGDDR